MTVEIFLTLLVFFSTATSLATEAFKKLIGNKIPYNILVLIIAMIVGCVGVYIYYILNNIELNSINIIYFVLMGIANWIGAMVGYDKIKQLINQMGA